MIKIHINNKRSFLRVLDIIIRLLTIYILILPIHVNGNITYNTALVLSGGGARGLAHIGILRALEEVEFYPDLIVGTSIGAVIGALYACGYTSTEIENIVKSVNWNKILSLDPYREIEFISQKASSLPSLFSLRFDERLNITFPKNLLPMQGLYEFILQSTIHSEYASNSDFDSLAIPFRAIATDIKTGKMVILKGGSLAKAVSASSIYPFVFAPVAVDSFLLIDGGLTNNLPCDVAKEMGAEFIVASDMISRVIPLEHDIDLMTFLNQTINTMSFFSDTRNVELADVLIRPDIDFITSSDFDSIDVLIQKGYEETKKHLEKIKPCSKKNLSHRIFLENAKKSLQNMRIREIKFVNNKPTRKFVLKREMEIDEGDIWNTDLAIKSMRNLFSTRLFNNVNMSLKQVSENSIDLVVELEEAERTLSSFGARYDTEKEARAFISIQHRNFLGCGINNNVYLVASEQYRKLGWDFRAPRIFTTSLTNNFSLFQEYENIPIYQNSKRLTFGEFSRTGFEANMGFQLKRVGLTSVGLKYEHVNLSDNPTLNIVENTYDYGSILLNILVDDLDNYDFPTRGRSNNILYEHSISAIEFKHFDRVSVESINYETFNEIHTFYTNIKLCYLSSALSSYERFRLGGVNSLPGYHQDELWGNILLAAGLGYRVPIALGLYLNALCIFGNVWNNLESFNWTDIKMGVDLGLLIPTPFGPLTVDYGFNFSGKNLLYLSVGHKF